MSTARQFPPWIRTRVETGAGRRETGDLLADLRLATVCESARCPNLNECWHQRSATFMILGDRCSRNCAFCAVAHGPLGPPAADEPERVAEAAARLDLRFVVITSVTRDDLDDRGAGHFARTIAAVRARVPEAGIEVLTPDFGGQPELLEQVFEARPTVFNHNLETCERLTREIRSGADYRRSLAVLAAAAADGGCVTKSGIMVGLGETDAEVEEMVRDLRAAGVEILTIGQYLPPSREHRPLDRYVPPETFQAWARLARELGFAAVASAPMVRSSYRAAAMAEQARRRKDKNGVA